MYTFVFFYLSVPTGMTFDIFRSPFMMMHSSDAILNVSVLHNHRFLEQGFLYQSNNRKNLLILHEMNLLTAKRFKSYSHIHS